MPVPPLPSQGFRPEGLSVPAVHQHSLKENAMPEDPASAKTPKRKKGADRDAHAKQVWKAYNQAAIASNTTPPPILGPSTSSSASVSQPIIMVTQLHYRRPNHCHHHSPTILSLYLPHINIRIQLLSAQPHSESCVSGIALHTFIYNRLYTSITYLSIY